MKKDTENGQESGNGNSSKRPLILVTGATGYIGGSLFKVLEKNGERVRCMVRSSGVHKLNVGPLTEVFQGDVLRPETLSKVLSGVHTAYYFVHSMGDKGDFREQDGIGARNFGEAAKKAGVKRIIYLGGLGDDDENLSRHLRSRQEVGDVLRQSGVPVIEFRASIVIGSGSLPYELIRCLVQRMPVIFTPGWIRSLCQPIGIKDLLAYFIAAQDEPGIESCVFEIGGRDIVSYCDLMQEYARQRGIRRWIVPFPIMTPRMSKFFLKLVAPQHVRIGRRLISSLRNHTISRDVEARISFGVTPKGMKESIRNALEDESDKIPFTRWCDLLSSRAKTSRWGGVFIGSLIVDINSVEVPLPPDAAFKPIEKIGGENGWYYGNRLWRLRGYLDQLLGGLGMKHDRVNPKKVIIGDYIDCWRVVHYRAGKQLTLFSELKVPGRFWLQFEVSGDTKSTITLAAVFDPSGLWGLLCWFLLYPIHRYVFTGMLRAIGEAALKEECTSTFNIPESTGPKTSSSFEIPIPASSNPSSSKPSISQNPKQSS
jgi:uncharacterized protein YbjT (DUF2867 family)